MSAQNTVILAGHARGRYDEGRLSTVATPGHLLSLNSDGTYRTHNVAGGPALLRILIEDALIGKGLNDAYAIGDLARFYEPQAGEELNVLIPAAAAAIVVGDRLASNGDGTFKKANGTTDVNLVQAIEAKDNSAGGTPFRLKVIALFG
jgi:hypothetical protein